MQIAICDNDRISMQKLQSYIVEYKRLKKVHIDIYEFDSGEDLLLSELFFDLIFLDYCLPKTNGMQVARSLRSKNIPCDIVFITKNSEFVFESFEVAPYRFFTKPVEKDDINIMMDAFLAKKKRLAPILVINKGVHTVIPTENIIYLEGDGKYCTIRTTKESLHSSKTLSEVLNCLPQYCFFRIHKSYAVNMYFVSSIDNKYVGFKNGEKATISRNCICEFKQAYKEFFDNFVK